MPAELFGAKNLKVGLFGGGYCDVNEGMAVSGWVRGNGSGIKLCSYSPINKIKYF